MLLVTIGLIVPVSLRVAGLVSSLIVIFFEVPLF